LRLGFLPFPFCCYPEVLMRGVPELLVPRDS
jgi:hypothetical protein